MNKKKLFRLYREEGLAVRRRRGRKRATGTRAPMALPDGPNQRWSLDFVADMLSWGRRFRILCVVDDFTREALALVVDTSIGGHRMARELDILIARRGKPVTIVSDTGTEMTTHRHRLALHRARQAAAERRQRWRDVGCLDGLSEASKRTAERRRQPAPRLSTDMDRPRDRPEDRPKSWKLQQFSCIGCLTSLTKIGQDDR